MDIRIGSLIDGARAARGVVIVIDVFRAFTTAAVAFDKGVDRILLTASPEEALELRRQGLGQFCMGEVGGIRPDGFDFGNSPYELSQVDSLAEYDDPAQPQHHPQDRDIALQIDRCDFALRVTPEDGLLVARRCVG